MKIARFLTALPAFLLVCQAHPDPFKPGRDQQIKLGTQASDEIRKKEKVLPDSDERVRLLRRVGAKLVAQLSDKDRNWPYAFDVIRNKEVNAFALPGGKVFFFTGILDKITTEDQLAGVLAHELTHAYREHWAYAYRDNQKRNLLLGLGLIIGRANQGTADAVGLGSALIFDLPFSRKHETEADDMGFDTMVKAGYNPAGMSDVFRMLDKIAGSGKPPEFFSDHPADKKRVQRIEEKTAKLNRTFPPQTPLPWTKPGG